MEIKNNTDISSLIASSISKLNLNQANSVSSTKRQSKEPEQEFAKESVNDDIKIANSEKTSKSPINISEVKEYAESLGVELTDEEITYGLKYGRSVMADYSA